MHSPYRNPALDRIYNGLFCDDLQALMPEPSRPDAPSWARTLATQPADMAALTRLATDSRMDTRVTTMALRRLQALGQPVPRRALMGVVVEVPLDSGLDTLAAYRDGSARFIHGSGRTTLVEGPMAGVDPIVRRLLAAAQAVVDRIGPSDRPRGPAPQGNVRINFIVSDGLYFGEGPMRTLLADGLAGPVLSTAVQLLNELTALQSATA